MLGRGWYNRGDIKRERGKGGFNWEMGREFSTERERQKIGDMGREFSTEREGQKMDK